MRRVIILILCGCLLIPDLSFSQDKKKHKRHISTPELWWAAGHIFIAHKAFRITREVLAVTEVVKQNRELDNDSHGGQLDAFRHSYWMARLAQKINPRKAQKLGLAHEKGNYIDFKKHRTEDGILPDKISSAMDLYNNERGLTLGFENRTTDADSLKLLIIQAIRNGNMIIIYKDSAGNYLQCNDSLINLSEYQNTWSIPKCLIPSSRKRR
ncbi:MAG: hypothetical protein ABI772_15500 [Bacteroidota bacterium]